MQVYAHYQWWILPVCSSSCFCFLLFSFSLNAKLYQQKIPAKTTPCILYNTKQSNKNCVYTKERQSELQWEIQLLLNSKFPFTVWRLLLPTLGIFDRFSFDTFRPRTIICFISILPPRSSVVLFINTFFSGLSIRKSEVCTWSRCSACASVYVFTAHGMYRSIFSHYWVDLIIRNMACIFSWIWFLLLF